jgi:tetratricopeptide (TPR) repeat protein
MANCARVYCVNEGTKFCAVCLKESYCSSECQKLDWKIHKILCPCMKKGDKQRLPYSELNDKMGKLTRQAKLNKGTENEIRILLCRLSFVEHQFGNQIEGESYGEEGGVAADNWGVDVTLSNYCIDLACAHIDNHKRIYYLEKSLSILEPWRRQINYQKNKRIDVFEEEKIETLYRDLSDVENNIGIPCSNLGMGNSDKAGDYYDRAYGKQRVNGKEKTEFLYDVLMKKGKILQSRRQFKECKAVYEEACNLMATFHYPDHPIVLKTANFLVQVLIQLKEYTDAERYASVLYECLKGESEDTENEEVAIAANSIASVTYSLADIGTGGDILLAERLSRKSLRIMKRIHGPNYSLKASFLHTLSRVLRQKGSHDAEAKDLMEQSLALFKTGVNSLSIAFVAHDLAMFHLDMSSKESLDDLRDQQICIAKSYMKEAVEISDKICGPCSMSAVQFASQFEMLLMLKRPFRSGTAYEMSVHHTK